MKEADIQGKRILFFAPAFFNYENMIADKMREMGADVDMFDVRSVTGAFNRALLKISPAFFRNKSQKYYDSILEENKGKEYDFILIVKCDMTPEKSLKRFREVYPHAKMCLYLWDSVKNIPGIAKKFSYFDAIHSFDLTDCENYKELQFRPLFFCDQFRKETDDEDYKYDISFLGTIHSDRYAVIKQVQRNAEERGLKFYRFMYLQSKFIYYFYKLTRKEFRHTRKTDFCYEKKSAAEIADIVNKSRIILDIQHPQQTGLTMRTIEMIGMNKKMITTNKNVQRYDFFYANNIAVIDRSNFEIPAGFLESRYYPLTRDIYEKYSLRCWVLDVLS